MKNNKNITIMRTARRKIQLTASEFNWDIAPGKTIRAWGYNKSIPGAILEATQGETLEIQFTNRLPESTTVHWHGLRVHSAMDGTDETQRPVGPGETFVYTLHFPDAGTFWFHSHMNETEQMERGLYGAIIVRGQLEPVVDKERVMMIDDMKLNSKQEFTKPGWALPRFIERHDGREGNVCLINGKEMPEITMHAGQTERWRFINASSAKYFVLSLGGREFRIIGTDGGLLERPQRVTEVLITPGERMDILAGPFDDGDAFTIDALPYNRMTFLKAKHRKYATVNVDERKPSVAFVPETLRKIKPLAPQDAAVTRTVKFSVDPSLKHGIDFRVNNALHANDAPVREGELQVWEVSNTSLMDHPFHLHGFFFQVLEENGKAPAYRAWKDTYNLKPRSRVKIAWMPDNRKGRWMYHCHILEHHEAGMMGHFEVIGANELPTGHMAHAHHHH